MIDTYAQSFVLADGILKLPEVIANLVAACQAVRKHYRVVHGDRLLFTLDGNLVGDIGEALAVEHFGIKLNDRCGEGIDGTASDGRSVQIKTTGTGRGAAFRDTEHAQHLLFFSVNFAACTASIVYNGPEARVRAKLQPSRAGQKSVSMSQMRALDALVPEGDRLPRRDRLIAPASPTM